IDKKLVIEGNTGDSLQSFTNSSDIEIDDEGNFYIFDQRLQKVFKYGRDGKFLLSFCGRGTGPAEIDGAQDIAIAGDSITICSPGAAKGSIFDKNGNFGYHSTIFIPGLYYGVVDKGIGDDDILGYNPTFNTDDNQVLIGNEFVIKNKKYEKKIVLHTIPADRDPKDIEGAKIIFMPFAHYKDNIYYAPNFPESYNINVKDRNGNLKSIISKHAARIEYNPEEKKHYEEASSFSWNGEKIIPNCRLKSVLNGIYTDKYGHLLVWVSQKRKEGVKHIPSIDVFKDGEFQNTINLEEVKIVESHTPTDVTFNFTNDKLVVFDINDNIYSIYDYHYENMKGINETIGN
ncbi:MAG: hypothetical protein KKD38_08865, partial [Candidatus Delongbacteria bacterium]|nr:hypothetical protein [Candidatus Delongbacteria bacterium]